MPSLGSPDPVWRQGKPRREPEVRGAFAHFVPLALTLLRLVASPIAAWFLARHSFRAAVLTVLVAGITDWLDGWSARKLGVSGDLGVILDPLADKILLVTLFIALTALGLVPVPMLTLVLGRDLVIIVGATLLRLLRNYRRFTPSTLGKISTFFQIAFVLIVLLQAAWPHSVLDALFRLGLVLTALFTVLSGLDYIRRGIHMARFHAPA